MPWSTSTSGITGSVFWLDMGVLTYNMCLIMNNYDFWLAKKFSAIFSWSSSMVPQYLLITQLTCLIIEEQWTQETDQ